MNVHTHTAVIYCDQVHCGICSSKRWTDGWMHKDVSCIAMGCDVMRCDAMQCNAAAASSSFLTNSYSSRVY